MNDALVSSAIQGDEKALERLLNKFRDNAFSIALKFVKDSVEAEDVVQEAFIKVFLNINQFRTEAAFSTWLFRIVYVESIRLLRKKNQLYRLHGNLGGLSESESAVEYEESEFVVEEKVKEAMGVLSEREYVIVSLFYLSEKTIREIALITNQSDSNIKVILHRARKKMSNHLIKPL